MTDVPTQLLIDGEFRDAAAGAGFAASRPVIEVRGTCGDCGDAES